MAKRLLIPIFKRTSGAIAFSILGALYFFSGFASFFAPYSVSEQNLSFPYHPPSQIQFVGGQLEVMLMERVQVGVAEYHVTGETAQLEFFSKSEPYDLFGFIPMSHKFVQLDSENRNHQFYLLGSDSTGRDIFSRLLYGSQISLSIGLIGISITLVLGFIVGSIAGYYGGWVDFSAMRLVELLMSIPGLYLLLALRSAFMRPELSPVQVYTIIVVILSVIGWAGTARIIRGMTLSLRKRPFVQAAESFGVPVWLILLRHILPNIASYLLVAATLSIPGYILAEAALSFLGLGISEPSASWGLMLKQSQGNMIVFFMNFWWMLLPGVAIFVTVVAYNVLGDVLRDIVDPKMKL
ncbi:MAG: ABC transporter permease [Opitutae bacterium]|nr:ABC transporter permease [Opitutae bacterium]